ncbi:MAG TPA: type II secretion system F family protein [Verrucomicrobiae bacterium]|nr:type II secretion system F family protein [Verrucomicrobiae bacterium]
MAFFSYQAVNKSGSIINGTVEATDRPGALEALSREGLRPVSLKEQRQKASFDIKRLFKKRVKADSLVMFTRQLSTMVSAGVPLFRALTGLQANTEDAMLKEVLEQVSKDIQGGSTLADAFAKHPQVFSDVYINMTRAGETAGILDTILKRLALQQEKNAAIRKKVRSAMTYPMILLVITVGAFFGLMIFVVPQIGAIIKDLGGPDAELPLITQVMLGLSGFMQTFWYLIIGGIAAIFFLVSRYIQTPTGKRKFHQLLLRVPIVKNVIKKVALARFARTFAALLGAGVSVIESLKVTGRAIGNVVYEEDVARAIDEVKNGKQLSEALKKSSLFPPLISQMLAVGEETGQTDTVLIKVADFYDEEVDATIESLSSVIEPVMIVIMGAMVGLIAASVMGPISSLAQNIKQ